MRENREGTLHLLQRGHNLLGEGDLLTTGQIVFELKVDIVSATGDRPAHTAENLVEGLDVESGAEITTSDKHVANFLKL